MAVCDKCSGTGEIPNDESAKLSETAMLAECRNAGKRIFRGHIVKVDVAVWLTSLESEGTIRNMMSAGKLTTHRLSANRVGVSIRELAKLGQKK